MEILTLFFQNSLTFKEVPFFRGAMLHSLPDGDNLLMHNHIDNGFRYAYPLVQYKSIQGKAAIMCLNEGIDVIMQLMQKENIQIRIGRKAPETLLLESIEPVKSEVVVTDHFYTYHIEKWIALNSENYSRYETCNRMTDRISFLESILTANILSFLKGINTFIDKPLKCFLQDVSDKYSIQTNKGINMIAFDAIFQTNLELPDYIGLGKHTSLGFGSIIQEKHIN